MTTTVCGKRDLPAAISRPSVLSTALDLLSRGFWPVPIYPPGIKLKGRKEPTKGKEPIGEAWGAVRRTERELRDAFKKWTSARVGTCLGPGRGPDGKWLIDLEGDGPKAADSLAKLLGGEIIATMGWSATRGGHNLFTADGELLLKLLAAAGAKEGTGIKSGVWHLDALPGLEIRVGGYKADGTVKQVQSVVPPSPGTDGKAREWNGVETVAELPESAYAMLEAIGEQIAKTSADRADQEANHVGVGASDNGSRHADAKLEARILAYLAKLDPAVDGEGGSNTAYRGACIVVRFGIEDPETICRLLHDWNKRCKPAWSHAELLHKAQDAVKEETRRDLAPGRGKPPPPSSNGDGHHDEPEVNEAADDPHRLARIYLDKHCKHKGRRTLVFYRAEFHRWENSAYRPVSDHELNVGANRTAKAEFDRLNRLAIKAWKSRGEKDEKGNPCPAPVARKVSTRLIGDMRQALCAMTFLPERLEPPAWLIDNPPFPAADVVPFGNALVHLPSFVAGKPGAIHPPTPDYFCTYALDFAFDPKASPPEEWNAFASSVWPDDPESRETLEEWMGYCLIPDTRQQTIAFMIGPTRSGRGTIARVMQALVGPANVAHPTFSGIASHFGAQGLIGKPLAIFGDARLSRRTDWAAALERLLMISGEDSVSIPRKNREDWQGMLPTRFMFISNELPEIPDDSGALAGRLLVLRFLESFLGKEDQDLSDKLKKELPGICLLAIQGWKRLRDRGRFKLPESSKDMLDQFRELSSPIKAYFDERLVAGKALSVQVEEVYADWKAWCVERNRQPGTDAQLGKKLRTVVPQIKTTQSREGGKRPRYFEGIDFKGDPAF